MADITYNKINWENEPSHNTPLSAENLNKMDTAIYDLVVKSNSLIPNPVSAPTEGLEKLEYDGTVYEVKGGHKILNDSGSVLTQMDNMQFNGVYTHNASTITEVDIVREFQSVADIEALTGEAQKGFQYIDDDVYDAFTAGDIGFDNSDTSFTGNDVQEVLEEVDDKLNGVINPPDLSNVTRESLTSGTFTEITSTGKWYCVTAENQQTSGSCMAYLLDSTYTYYLSATQTPDGDWKRATTSWLYFPAGAKFYVRAIFTYAGNLCSAPCL